LLELRDKEFSPFYFKNSKQQFKSINCTASLKNMFFFFDSKNGGYIYNKKELIPLPEKLSNLLKTAAINKAIFTDQENLYFGTIKNGIYTYNLKTNVYKNLSKKSGIYNNTVLGLKYGEGNLWAALDNGISKIDTKQLYSFYQDHTDALGTVYDAAFFNDNYYLASNTGIYSFNSNNELIFIQGSEGQTWNLSIFNDLLIANHNSGSYQIKDTLMSPINLDAGGVFYNKKTPSNKNILLEGTYTGISVIKKEKKKWLHQGIEGINFPVNKILFESDFIIWATHPYKGVFRIHLNQEYTKALKIKSFGAHFKQYKTNLHKINDTILFYNYQKWFQYFKENDSIGNFLKFKKFTNKDYISKEVGGSWFIDRKKTKEFIFTDNKFNEKLHLNPSEIKERLVAGHEKIIKKNDSIRIINLNDGISIFNIKKLKTIFRKTNRAPLIDKIYSNTKHFPINDTIITIPFKYSKTLNFEIYTPNQQRIKHSYILSGEINQKNTIDNGKIKIQNLPYGNYLISITNIEHKEKDKKIKNFYFKILPPWYLSYWMKLIYLLLLIIAIYTISKINKIKIRKQQIALQQEFNRETRKKINKIEKENLEKEIYSKKRELTNTTASIIKKNEIIVSLRGELNRLLDVSPNQYRSKRILDISKDSINNEKDWKMFESNFNELNEDFFKKLVTNYPKLTSKDLKLCAYIKTGLTSKEVAPLMGISLRGVELHRYRLRKKLNIQSNINITKFLQNFTKK